MPRKSYTSRALVDEPVRQRPRDETKDENREEQRLGINRRPMSTGRSRFLPDFSRKNEEKRLGIDRTSNSTGGGDSNDRMTTTRANRIESSSRPTVGIYERTFEQKVKRDAEIARIRQEMMKECTFTPKTLHSSMSTASPTTTSNTSTDTRCMLDDVYERLYRHAGSNVSTPQKGRNRLGSSVAHSTHNSGMSRSSSACSSRIEELYQDGKRKIRSRGKFVVGD